MSTWSVTQLNESSPGIITSGALFVIFYLIPPHPSPLFRAPWYFVERKRAFPDLPLPNPNWLRKVCSFKLCKIYPLTHKLLQLCNWVVTFATFVDSATGNLSSRPAFPLPHFLTFPACIYPLTQAPYAMASINIVCNSEEIWRDDFEAGKSGRFLLALSLMLLAIILGPTCDRPTNVKPSLAVLNPGC